MTAVQILEGLISNTGTFMLGAFFISVIILLMIMPRIHERIYIVTLISSTVPLFSCIMPSAVYIVYSVGTAYRSNSIEEAIFPVVLFFLPSIILVFLCLVVFVRHWGVKAKSYKVEASIALLITVVTATIWIPRFADALQHLE